MPTYTDEATGRSVTSDAALSPHDLEEAFAPSPENLQGYAAAEAKRQGLPPELALNVLRVESASGADTRDSSKGAIGPMQLMPGTAKELGVDPRDPWQNVQGGVRYLKQQYAKYDGDPVKTLAAYNAGPGAVDKYGGVPPYAETLGYVQKATPRPAPQQAPLVPPAMADASPPPLRMPFDPPFLASQATEPGGPIEREAAGRAGTVVAKNVLPFLVPAGESMLGAGALSGAYSGINEAAHRIGDKGLTNLDSGDYAAIGKAVGIGAAVGMTLHGVVNAIFGKADATRRAADETLTMGGVKPPVPVDAAGKTAMGNRVEDLISGAAPQVTTPEVDAAYDAFKASTQGRTLDVTAYNNTLARFAAKEFPANRVAASDRLLDPVGKAVTVPGRGTRWYATADDLTKSENGIAFATRQKNPAGQTSYPGGLMKKLRGELQAGLRSALTGTEQDALTAARGVSMAQHQAESALDLLNGARSPEGVVNATQLARQLSRDPGRYAAELGQDLYDQTLTIARAGDTLMKQPGGRLIFAQLLERIPGALVGGAVGGSIGNAAGGYGSQGGLAGAVAGAAAPPAMLAPSVMRVVEGLARHRQGAGHVAEGVGRLAVALAQDAVRPPPDSPLGPGMPR